MTGYFKFQWKTKPSWPISRLQDNKKGCMILASATYYDLEVIWD
jgi:hypothetical protein